jgi:hypothetical protein
MNDMSKKLNLLVFKDKLYMRVIPGKKLFQSNLVHSVVNRGDVFAVDMETGVLTILPGVAQVEHVKGILMSEEKKDVCSQAAIREEREMFLASHIDALLRENEGLREMCDALKAEQSEDQPAAPAPGWKVTEAQHVAACKVLLRANGLDGLPQRMVNAMLSAAPTPQPAAKKE